MFTCAKCGHQWQTMNGLRPSRCPKPPCRTMAWETGHKTTYRTHGQYLSPTYQVWLGMKQRCLNPKNPRYKDYGGCGIGIYKPWLVFSNFYTDMGDRPMGKSLDRYPDQHGDYSPTNCRWATATEQQNNMRNNHLVTWNSKTQTVRQWSRELNINVSTLSKRLSRGWSVQRTMQDNQSVKGDAQ